MRVLQLRLGRKQQNTAMKISKGFASSGTAVSLLVLLLAISAAAIPASPASPGTSPTSLIAAGKGSPPPAAPKPAGSPTSPHTPPSKAPSSALASPKPAALPHVPPAPQPQKPAQQSPSFPSPLAPSKSPAAPKPTAPAKPAVLAGLSLKPATGATPIPVQTRTLTALPSPTLSPSPPDASANSGPAAPAAAPKASQKPSAPSKPRAAPLPNPSPTLAARPAPPPPSAAPAPSQARQPAYSSQPVNTVLPLFPLADQSAPTPTHAVPAPLQARQSASNLPSIDSALKMAAGTVAAATAAAGLLRMSDAPQKKSTGEAPVRSPEPIISLRAPSRAPAYSTVAPAQAPGPLHRKLAFPAIMAPSPAELILIKQREQAPQNMQAAYTMVNKIKSYIPAPQAALSTTPVSPPPEQPPVPVNVTSKESKSAVSLVTRISGSGITPFTAQKQQQLINVFVDATSGNLTAPQFSVLLVSSAFSSRHRSLLQNPIIAQGNSKGTPLKNVVDVTMEVTAGTPGYAAVVRDELAALIIGKTYLDVALQRVGLTTWSIKLLTISIVQPSQSNGMLPCQKTFGRWCLDKSGLTIPLVVLIAVVGSALLVFTVVLIIVIKEVKKSSGMTAGLEYPKNDSITMKTHILTYVIGDHAHPSPSNE